MQAGGRSLHFGAKVKSQGSADMVANSNRSATGGAAVTSAAAAANHSDGANVKINSNNSNNDFKTKTVLKEAVDAVVSSFAKHTQGYGRGNSFISIFLVHF